MSSKQNKTIVTTTKTTTNQPQSNKSRRNKRRKARRRANRAIRNDILPRVNTLHIAPCTREYMKAIVNPFAVQGQPCIPDSITLPSFKISCRARGNFSTSSTTGVGFIIVDPFQMLANNAGSGGGNYNGAGKYTISTYTFATLSYNDGAGPVVGLNTVLSDSIFAYADLVLAGAYRQFRLVGCGLAIKYTGSELYNQGTVVGFRVQGNGNLVSGVTQAALLQDKYSSILPVKRNQSYIYYVPDDPAYLAYNPFSEYYNQGGIAAPVDNINHNSMGFMISGGAIGNPQSWSYEVIAFFELIGNGMFLTQTHSDVQGMGQVLASLPNAAPTTTANVAEKSVMDTFIKTIQDATHLLPGYITQGVKIGQKLYDMVD